MILLWRSGRFSIIYGDDTRRGIPYATRIGLKAARAKLELNAGR